MKFRKMSFLWIILATLCTQLQALDINEKLTLRILRLSLTKKTVLINRGVEDGLAVGDHAKFYLTSGMIARGVVEKVSPSRSVWSIYRLIEPDQLIENKVINLKIATPVKVTIDESKMIAVEPIARVGRDIPLVRDTGVIDYNPNQIPLSTRSIVRDADMNATQEMAELAALRGNKKERVIGDTNREIIRYQEDELTRSDLEIVDPRYRRRSLRTYEVFGTGQFSNLSTEVVNDVNTVNTNGESGGYDFTIGIESFWPKDGAWYDRVSVGGLLHFGSADTISVSGTQGENTLVAYGLLGRYYFYNHPLDIDQIIGYGGFSFGAGSVDDRDDSSASGNFSGDATFYSVGGGIKYFWGRFGFTSSLDYYARNEDYTITDSTNLTTTTNKYVRGIRALIGLMWKFDI